jgi:hypothetical protein
MDMSSLFAGLVVSSVGFVAWKIGRRRERMRLMVLGGSLTVLPILSPSTGWTWGLGAVLTAACFLP